MFPDGVESHGRVEGVKIRARALGAIPPRNLSSTFCIGAPNECYAIYALLRYQSYRAQPDLGLAHLCKLTGGCKSSPAVPKPSRLNKHRSTSSQLVHNAALAVTDRVSILIMRYNGLISGQWFRRLNLRHTSRRRHSICDSEAVAISRLKIWYIALDHESLFHYLLKTLPCGTGKVDLELVQHNERYAPNMGVPFKV